MVNVHQLLLFVSIINIQSFYKSLRKKTWKSEQKTFKPTTEREVNIETNKFSLIRLATLKDEIADPTFGIWNHLFNFMLAKAITR